MYVARRCFSLCIAANSLRQCRHTRFRHTPAAFRVWPLPVRASKSRRSRPLGIPHESPTASATYAPLPRYPYEARLRRLEPKMMLELRVASNGSVHRLNVVQSPGFAWLDRSTADTLRQWRFKAGVAGRLRIPVTFSLRCPKIAEEQHRNRLRE